MSDPETNVTTPTKNEAQRRSLSFSFSELWQQIPKPSNPEKEAEVLVERPPRIILGDLYKDETEFKERIQSLIWLTYRTGFEPIAKNPDGPHPLSFIHSMVFNRNPFSTNVQSFVDNENFTTDVGWGCMIRTSQTLLANTYARLIGNDTTQEITLVDLFKDDSKSPFSLHNFIRVANELPLQVKPGQWFGPNAASLSIQRLVDHVNIQYLLPKLKVLISDDSMVYDEKVKGVLSGSPLLILLPVRLGIDKTNTFYFNSILQLLNCKQSVGIAGGRPSSSFYFFGYDGEELFYLDPHYPQSLNQDYNTYHTNSFQKLNINEVDPSMLIGILVNDEEDYNSFKKLCVEGENKIVQFAAKMSEPPEMVDFDDEDDKSESEAEMGGSYDIVK